MEEKPSVAEGVDVSQDDPKWLGLDAQKAYEGTPFLGSGQKTISDIYQGFADAEDGGDLAIATSQLVTKSANFAAECAMEAGMIALDPIGWLVENGLEFLFNLIQPLQDALHLVTGDGPSLEQASGDFEKIGSGFVALAADFARTGDNALQEWTEEAGDAAREALADFAAGIEGLGSSAGSVAETLKMWSMVMKIIEDVVKAIITEFISWLIYIWLPALASSVVTLGGSVATAMSVSIAKGASTFSRITKKLGKLGKLLDEFVALLKRFGDNLAKYGKKLGVKNPRIGNNQYAKAYDGITRKGIEVATATKGMSKVRATGKAATEALKEGGKQAATSTVGIDPTSAPSNPLQGGKAAVDMADTWIGHAKDGKEWQDRDELAEKHSADETRKNLDL